MDTTNYRTKIVRKSLDFWGTSGHEIQAVHEEDVERKGSLGEDGMPPGRSVPLESDKFAWKFNPYYIAILRCNISPLPGILSPSYGTLMYFVEILFGWFRNGRGKKTRQVPSSSLVPSLGAVSLRGVHRKLLGGPTAWGSWGRDARVLSGSMCVWSAN